MLKSVQCSNCSVEYLYKLTRSASGSGNSLYMLDNQGASNRASNAAHRNLMNVLERAFDPVPCPKCGWYQPFMIPKMRRMHWKWVTPVVVTLGILAAIVFFVSIVFTAQYY